LDSINNLELVIFNKDIPIEGAGDLIGANAFVFKSTPNKIYVNLDKSQRDDTSWVGTLVHEIQHLLYFIRPMTPDVSITQFKGSDDCYRKNKEIYKNTELEEKDKLLNLNINQQKINSIATDLGFDVDRTSKIIKKILSIAYAGWDESYFRGDKSEFLSRIQGMRQYMLNNTNRINLTKDDFIKYFNDNKENIVNLNDSNVRYILGYWVSKGFPPLESFANDINTSFVKSGQNNIKNSKIDKYLSQQPNKIDPNRVA